MILVAEDTFNRASSSSSLGTADFGGAWSVPMPSPGDSPWGIDSHKAYCVSPSTATFTTLAGIPKNIAVIGSTAEPHIVSADFTLSTTSPNVGLVAKYVDTSNFILAALRNTSSSGIEVIICIAGTYTSLGSATRIVTKGATYRMRVTVDTTVQVDLDGAGAIGPITLSAPQIAALSGPTAAGLTLLSGRYDGILPNDPGDSRFDNFVFGIPDPGGWSVGFLKF